LPSVTWVAVMVLGAAPFSTQLISAAGDWAESRKL